MWKPTQLSDTRNLRRSSVALTHPEFQVGLGAHGSRKMGPTLQNISSMPCQS